MAMATIIEIDGSYLEGGGQILRTACALAAVTGEACRIFNIRKGRPRPGLRPQHLAGLEALAFFCGGRLEGASRGSTEITFSPGADRKAELDVEIGTAGSITLVLQSLMPVAVMASSPLRVIFRGGATDTFFAPGLDYFTEVFLAVLGRMGVRAEVEAARRGYYPAGGARAMARIFPCRPAAMSLTARGALKRILLLSRASASLRARSVAERQAAGAREALRDSRQTLGGADVPIEDRISYHDSSCPGSSICLVAVYENSRLGTDGLGKIGTRAEDVGREAARGLLGEMATGASLDRHMADQILPFMALSGRECAATVSEITTHAKTNMWVAEKFIRGKFEAGDGLVKWSPA